MNVPDILTAVDPQTVGSPQDAIPVGTAPVGGPAAPPTDVSRDPNAAQIPIGTAPDQIQVGMMPDQPPSLTPGAHPAVSAGVSEYLHGQNPLNLITALFGGGGMPGTAVANSIVANAAARITAARQAAAQGDPATAAMHYVGALPFIGPMADNLTTAVKSGDDVAIAKALGDIASIVFPITGGIIGPPAAEAAASTPTATAIADSAQAGAESRIAQAMAPANGKWGTSRNATKLAASADDVAPAVLAAKPSPATFTRQGMADFVNNQLAAASTAWDAAEAQRLPNRPIETGPIIAQLQARLDGLTAQPMEGSLPQRTPVTTASPILDPTTGQPITTMTDQAQPIGQAVDAPIGPIKPR